MTNEPEREKVGLPPRIFMYTADQIGTMLELKVDYVLKTLFFLDKREPGLRPKTRMRAINIAPEGEKPEWRVTENELLRYLRHRGVKFYERGFGL